MQKEKRLTLNAEKRKTIENVFQSHWEREDSPVMSKSGHRRKKYLRHYETKSFMSWLIML
jgi:hypothetical protein